MKSPSGRVVSSLPLISLRRRDTVKHQTCLGQGERGGRECNVGSAPRAYDRIGKNAASIGLASCCEGVHYVVEVYRMWSETPWC